MSMKRNDKGAVLVWAVVITSVLIIIIGAVLTFSLSFYKRSINNNYARQAYFTSRSVVEAVSAEIKNGTDNGNDILDLLNNAGDVVNLEDISFSEDSGNIGVTVAYVELFDIDTIKITASTTIENQTKKVTASLEKGSGTTLPIGEDFPGLNLPEDVTVVNGTHSITNSTLTDIYARDTATVTINSDANYSGTIYTEDGAKINILQGAKSGGVIFAQSGTVFTFNKLHNKFDSTIYVKDGAVINVNGKNYTITKNGSTKRVNPSGMNSSFKALIYIYTGSETGNEGWGDTKFE
ncbi:MAG TPA: hypothetical protein DCP51_08365 [Clostridiales bacterium]|nr:hypothetical protein [Clostridiales bacterium]